MAGSKEEVFAIAELKSIITSQALHRVISKRKKYLQGKVNEYVQAKNLISAYGELCKLKDMDKFVEMLQRDYDKLVEAAEKEKEKE